MRLVEYILHIFLNGEYSHKQFYDGFPQRSYYQEGFNDALELLKLDATKTYAIYEEQLNDEQKELIARSK
jgi:hypothetical protein